jgi:hypothetical protein
MDMSFARRRKAKPTAGTPDLSVLLAEMSARQGASRTAVVQAQSQAVVVPVAADPLVDIFAPLGASVAATHRFSDKAVGLVIPCKLK